MDTALGGGLNGRRAEWTVQVASFYDKLNQQPKILERLGITPAELEQAQAMVEAF